MAHPGAADLAKEGCVQVKTIRDVVERMTYNIKSTLATVESGPSDTFGNNI